MGQLAQGGRPKGAVQVTMKIREFHASECKRHGALPLVERMEDIMRKWTLTVGLGLTALVAMLVAPQLVAVVSPAPVQIATVPAVITGEALVQVAAPAMSEPVVIAESFIAEVRPIAPPPQPVAQLRMKSPRHQTQQPIAETQVPYVVTYPSPPEIDHFWDGCPACGMG
jgi:xanthosine utilization system XapX-like protein